MTAIARVPQPQSAMDEIRQAELDSHTFTGCTQQSPVRRLRIVEVFVEFVAEYEVSGFSRTSTVRLKADTTYVWKLETLACRFERDLLHPPVRHLADEQLVLVAAID